MAAADKANKRPLQPAEVVLGQPRQRQASAAPALLRRPTPPPQRAVPSGCRCAACGINEGRPHTDGLCSACWREEVVRETKELKRKREEELLFLSARGSSSSVLQAGGGAMTARAAPSASVCPALVPMPLTARSYAPEPRATAARVAASACASAPAAAAATEPAPSAAPEEQASEPMQLDTPSPQASATAATAAAFPVQARSAALDALNVAFRDDGRNAQRVSEYAEGIHTEMFELERRLVARPDCMDLQPDINKKMRAILFDWMVEVHERYRYRAETLFLAQNLVDRYLSVRLVTRGRLQLVGTTSMMIAAKFEEIDVPKAEEFAYITEDTYSKDEVIKMECEILTALDFEVVAATPVHFLDRLLRANGSDAVQRALTSYLLELGFLDVKWLRFLPSLAVSAAIFVSNDLMGRHPAWPAAMVHHSHYQEHDLAACATHLRAQLAAARDSTLRAVPQKYESEAYQQVSLHF